MRAKGKRNFLVKVRDTTNKKTKTYEVSNTLTFAEAAPQAYRIHNCLVFGSNDDKGNWQIQSINEKLS